MITHQGQDPDWLEHYGNSAAYRFISDYADFTATSATSNGMHLNSPYPLSKVGQMLVDIDHYQDFLEASESDQYTGMSYQLLDAGCGSGHILALASSIFFYEAVGFDLSAHYLHLANELRINLGLHENNMRTFESDARLFPNYSAYDVVVLNRLFVGPGQQAELECSIQNDIKPGAYLVQLNNITTPESWYVASEDGIGGRVVRKPVT